MVETFNQELADLSLLSGNQLLSAPYGENNYMKGESAVSALLLTPMYQFQQKTIDALQAEIEQMKLSYNKLLSERNDQKIELENCQREIKLKVFEIDYSLFWFLARKAALVNFYNIFNKDTKLDELSQTLSMEVVFMKGELLKSNHRIQSSLMNVNKRMEEEILKLRASLNEQTVRNGKLSEQVEALKEKEFENSRSQLVDSIQAMQSQMTAFEHMDTVVIDKCAATE